MWKLGNSTPPHAQINKVKSEQVWGLDRVINGDNSILTNSEINSEFGIKATSIPDDKCPTYGELKSVIPDISNYGQLDRLGESLTSFSASGSSDNKTFIVACQYNYTKILIETYSGLGNTYEFEGTSYIHYINSSSDWTNFNIYGMMDATGDKPNYVTLTQIYKGYRENSSQRPNMTYTNITNIVSTSYKGYQWKANGGIELLIDNLSNCGILIIGIGYNY